jgi:hypothetical protein
VSTSSTILARVGAVCYIGWGAFHVKVAHDIFMLGAAQSAIAQGRLYQLSAYMLSIALFAIVVAALGNWRNSVRSYWLNLIVIGWADLVWVLVVVLPGYTPLVRGLLPPAVYFTADSDIPMPSAITSDDPRSAEDYLWESLAEDTC